MSGAEFFDWMLYESIEPFGDRRADVQAGTIAAMILNVNRSKNSDKVWTYQDFFQWEPEPPKAQQTVEEQAGFMRQLQQVQNAQVEAG